MERRNLKLLAAANHQAMSDALDRTNMKRPAGLELARFLFLHRTFPDNTISPSIQMDRLWHELILDTKGYAAVCKITNNKLVHHYPQRANDTDEQKIERYGRMLAGYEKEFKEKAPEDFWPARYITLKRKIDAIDAPLPMAKRIEPMKPGSTVFVKTLTGKTVTINDVYGQMLIVQFKLKYENKEGVPVDMQRLIFGGKDLEDEKSLAHYNIQDCSTLHSVLKLRGC
jgi:hypothetical protein